MVGLACLTVPAKVLERAAGWRYATLLPAAMIGLAILSTVFSQTPFLSLGGSNWRRLGLPAEISLAAFIALQTESVRREPRYSIWCLRASCATLFASSIAVILQAQGAEAILGLGPSHDPVRPGGLFGCRTASAATPQPLFLCLTLWLLDHRLLWRYFRGNRRHSRFGRHSGERHEGGSVRRFDRFAALRCPRNAAVRTAFCRGLLSFRHRSDCGRILRFCSIARETHTDPLRPLGCE